MRKFNILLLFISIFLNVNGQCKIYFPNYIDQARRPELSYSYMTGFPIEITGTEIGNVSCDNGKIVRDTINARYFCYPKRIGSCTIKVISKENGESKIYSKSINIIKKPKLNLEITKISLKDSSKIFYKIIDLRTHKNVLTEYFAGEFFVKFIYKNKSEESFAISDFNGTLDFSEFIDLKDRVENISKVCIEIYLFGKESDLFAQAIKKEIEIE